jgi:peroxiredoxin
MAEPGPCATNTRFPDFTLQDLTGRRWVLDDLRTGRTVVFCFASW